MFLVLLTGAFGSFPAIASAASKGAFSFAQLTGSVQVKVDGMTDPSGKPVFLSAEQVKTGEWFLDGHTIVTGKAKGSSAILLFSNGVVVTLKEDTQFQIHRFLQAKFEPLDQKIVELEQEPSSSLTKLRLHFGEITMGVKLRKDSVIQVSSPFGTAELRNGLGVFTQVVRPGPGGGWRGSLVVPKGEVALKTPSSSPSLPQKHHLLQAGQVVSLSAGPLGKKTIPFRVRPRLGQMEASMDSVKFAYGLNKEATLESVSTSISEKLTTNETLAVAALASDLVADHAPEPTDPEPTDPSPTDPDDPEPTGRDGAVRPLLRTR